MEKNFLPFGLIEVIVLFQSKDANISLGSIIIINRQEPARSQKAATAITVFTYIKYYTYNDVVIKCSKPDAWLHGLKKD